MDVASGKGRAATEAAGRVAFPAARLPAVGHASANATRHTSQPPEGATITPNASPANAVARTSLGS